MKLRELIREYYDYIANDGTEMRAILFYNKERTYCEATIVVRKHKINNNEK